MDKNLSLILEIERESPEKAREELISLLDRFGSFRACARSWGCHHSTVVRLARRLGVLSPKSLPLTKEAKKIKNSIKTKVALEYLSEQGFTLVNKKDDALAPQEEQLHYDLREGVKIGFVSDIHYASRYQSTDILKEAYNYFRKEKVDFVVNPGDVFEGSGRVYVGQLHEMFLYGLKAQLNYALHVEPYPYISGVTTYMISGNHDLSFYRETGLDPVYELCEARQDLHYLGQQVGVIKIKDVRIALYHGEGGLGKDNFSAKAGEIVTKMPEPKPHIVFCGHWHRSGWFPHSNGLTDVVFCGSLQRTTPYIKKLLGRCNRGYGVIEIKKDKYGVGVNHEFKKRGY